MGKVIAGKTCLGYKLTLKFSHNHETQQYRVACISLCQQNTLPQDMRQRGQSLVRLAQNLVLLRSYSTEQNADSNFFLVTRRTIQDDI